MLKRTHILLTAATLLLCFAARGQNNRFTSVSSAVRQSPEGEFSVFSSITKYLAAGDAASLSAWFADNLDITIISSSRNCSRKQAREILRTFFEANTPRSFQVAHKASEANRKYMIGLLNAGGELFQVTIYATSSGGDTYKIQQLNISRQTDAY
ncbi:MAG: DUF4783 domain-containing protein [Bacteroidales bacterium]|nr:DUF4783 domain-containing protein [Bacteroidales bacterium]